MSVWLPATPIASAMARQAGRALGVVLSRKRGQELALLLTELVANSVRHARTPAGNNVSLELLLFSDLVRVEVRDRGEGFTPPPAPEPGEPRASGWGFVLVDRLADRWGVGEEQPTLVWAEFDRREGERPRVG